MALTEIKAVLYGPLNMLVCKVIDLFTERVGQWQSRVLGNCFCSQSEKSITCISRGISPYLACFPELLSVI